MQLPQKSDICIHIIYGYNIDNIQNRYLFKRTIESLDSRRLEQLNAIPAHESNLAGFTQMSRVKKRIAFLWKHRRQRRGTVKPAFLQILLPFYFLTIIVTVLGEWRSYSKRANLVKKLTNSFLQLFITYNYCAKNIIKISFGEVLFRQNRFNLTWNETQSE